MGMLCGLLFIISVLPVAILLPLTPTKVGIALVVGWILLIWVAIVFARQQFHYLALLWVAFYPYCYYLFSYPAERAAFTVDRAFIVLVIVELFIGSRRDTASPLPRDIRVSAYLWGVYLLVCSISLVGRAPSEILSSYRLLVDGMLMPALFGWYAIRYFPALKDLRKLHLSVSILGIGLCISGLVELITGKDLFPWPGSEPLFTETHLRRADGPFELQIVLSLVAILCFFFILYLRRLMPQVVSPARALLHKAGALASFVAALLPLDRGLVLVLIPIAVIDSFSKERLLPRRIWVAVFGIILLAAFAAKLLDPRLYDDRVSNPENFYQRVAQQSETLRVVREYPLFGVGLGLYPEMVASEPRFMVRWKGIQSMSVPHNVLMTILSEEGLVGLLFYVFAQVFFIRAMWRIRKAHRTGWLAFLYCVLAYQLTGLDFGTVYYSDVNLFYLFVLGVIYQLQTGKIREQELSNRPYDSVRSLMLRFD